MQVRTVEVTIREHHLTLTDHEVLVLANALYFSKKNSGDDVCWQTQDSRTGETQAQVRERLVEGLHKARGF